MLKKPILSLALSLCFMGPAFAQSKADALLSDDLPSTDDSAATNSGVHGSLKTKGTYTLPGGGHWSEFNNTLILGTQGQINEDFKYKLSGRVDYDAIYSLSDHYNSDVRKNQRYQSRFDETYLDWSKGNFDLRLGRQQIIWGEVVGLFFADVVSAKDLRNFVAADFDDIRIPQWAARAEYFSGDQHLEAIFIPVGTLDEIGKPGANFYPYPPVQPGFGYAIRNEVRPREDSHNFNYGVRASTLTAGWDVAAFAYRSTDASPTFLRQVLTRPVPTLVYTPVHERITQYGTTFSKDLDFMVLKGEVVYAQGQNFNVTRLSDSNGVVPANYLDYILSGDVNLVNDQRVNVQLFQRHFFNYDTTMLPNKNEFGASLFYSIAVGKFAPEILAVHSLNHNDWMLRPKVVYTVAKNVKVALGADVFGGHPTGLFGQYDKQDRITAEARLSF